MTPRQLGALRVLERLCRLRPWATACDVWQFGGGENVKGAGRLLATLSRHHLVEVLRSPNGRTGPTRYRPTPAGVACLRLEERR